MVCCNKNQAVYSHAQGLLLIAAALAKIWKRRSPFPHLNFPFSVIYFIVWLVRENTNKNGSGDKKSLDVLKERYAKGEITKEQFESMKKDISS